MLLTKWKRETKSCADKSNWFVNYFRIGIWTLSCTQLLTLYGSRLPLPLTAIYVFQICESTCTYIRLSNSTTLTWFYCQINYDLWDRTYFSEMKIFWSIIYGQESLYWWGSKVSTRWLLGYKVSQNVCGLFKLNQCTWPKILELVPVNLRSW